MAENQHTVIQGIESPSTLPTNDPVDLTINAERETEVVTETNTAIRPHFARWTRSGYPIVDGRYHDLSTGEIKEAEDEFIRTGPPALDVHWYNRNYSDMEDQFRFVAFHSPVEVTEYLRRVGNFLGLAKCRVMSLNATKYSVNLIISTEMANDEMMKELKNYNLLPALKFPNDPVYP